MVRSLLCLVSLLLPSTQAFVPLSPLRAFVPRKNLQTLNVAPSSFVERVKAEHTLYYVPNITSIDYNKVGVRPDTVETVEAWQLTNDKNLNIKAMARGANMVALNVSDTRYVWENIEGAVYYGASSGNFPYQRGLSLNGGVRFAAVCAEHGLYYDTDWDVSFSDQTTSEGKQSKSIIFAIVDNAVRRQYASETIPDIMTAIVKPSSPLLKGFSSSQFSNTSEPMSKYPITNMEYKFNITLVEGEDFVRLRMSVKNFDDFAKNAEAWLPMTFPIDEQSIILSRQKNRWRRDTWCFPDLPNMVEWDKYPKFQKCLDWPTGGIFYDFPKKDGRFHGVVTDSKAGTGVVYVCPDEKDGLPHYTKMWSWGNKDNFIQGGGSELTEGRPASEYYEPWSSGTNFAFFNSARFDPMTEVTWDVAILPITSGLTGTMEDMLDFVDFEIDKRPGLLGLTGVQKIPIVRTTV